MPVHADDGTVGGIEPWVTMKVELVVFCFFGELCVLGCGNEIFADVVGIKDYFALWLLIIGFPKFSRNCAHAEGTAGNMN